MSKKDCQAIARAIHEVRAEHGDKPVCCAVQALTGRLSDVLAADNPRFDRARFIEACETGRTKGMPR